MDATQFSYIDCTYGSTTLNSSRDIGTSQDGIKVFKPFISAEEFYWSILTLSFTLIISSCVGIVSNILVVKTYLKIGFSESINISFFAYRCPGHNFVCVCGGGGNLLCLFMPLVCPQRPCSSQGRASRKPPAASRHISPLSDVSVFCFHYT